MQIVRTIGWVLLLFSLPLTEPPVAAGRSAAKENANIFFANLGALSAKSPHPLTHLPDRA